MKPKTYTFTFTPEMLNTVSLALGEIPTKLGMPLINELNRQIAAQNAVEAEPSLPLQNGHGNGAHPEN
jgi:hypothetical protein